MNDDWWESIKRCAENVRQRSPTHLRKRIADLEAELAATKQELSGLRSDYQAAEEEIETQTEWKEKAQAELSALKDRLDKAQTIDIDPANPPYQITIRGTSGIKRVKIVEVEG